jgi:hypothetical protein
MKKNNASILLADGSQIGAQQNSVKYRDLSGSIGDMMKALVSICYAVVLFCAEDEITNKLS